MTQDDIERAFLLVAREYVAVESFFNAGWDAAKREDEQRIAELERELAAANTLLKTTLALRALGQSEEVKP